MKRILFVGSLVILLLGLDGHAEANTGLTFRNLWGYLFSPVNCVGNFVHDVAASTVKTIWCVIGNVNRNPVTLTPLITTNPADL